MANHPNVVLHLDIDYFYAQVEEVLNPELKSKPFGIQQGLNIVTCNYIARSFGIKKWRPMKECLEKCPELVLVNGEDLSNYKVYSKRMSELLHTTVGPTERMGLDEHYLDITKLVEEKMSSMSEAELEKLRIAGPFYPNEEAFKDCSCGCERRLMIGSQVAQSIRATVLEELKLTCSVGIAHNKLLAKLVGQHNKPDNQTVLAPSSAASFMAELQDLRSIMGVGGKTANRIEELGIASIADLQSCENEKLMKSFGAETAKRLKEMSMGVDHTEVKPSGKPKTVGLEDSCRPISVRSDAEEMFRELLPRLVTQIEDDGRIPTSIKVTVRKYDPVKKLSTKETKQCALLPSHFRCTDDKILFADGAGDAIMKLVMAAFDQIVGIKQKFLVNLVGLCFVKFHQQKRGSSSIESFLIRKPDGKTRSAEEVVEPINNEKSSAAENSFDEDREPSPKRLKTVATSEPSMEAESSGNIDPNVWRELPLDVQCELMRSWQQTTNCSEPPTSTKSKEGKKWFNHFQM